MPDKLPPLGANPTSGQYKPTFSHRLRYVWAKMWHGSIVWALFLGWTIYAQVVADDPSGKLAMWGLVAVTTLMLSFGARWFYRIGARYKVFGLQATFLDLDYYVPPDVFEKFVVGNILVPFRKFRPEGNRSLLNGNSVTFQPGPVQVPQGRAWGATWPGTSSRSLVSAPYALHPGVAGWELKLQACQKLFPGRSEEADIEWMRSNKIIV